MMPSRVPQNPQADVWSLERIATVFREVGSVLDGVVVRLKHPGVQPVSIHPALTELREIAGKLEPIRNRLWRRPRLAASVATRPSRRRPGPRKRPARLPFPS